MRPQIVATAIASLLTLPTVGHAGGAPTASPSSPSRPPPGDQRRIVGILDVRTDGVPPEVAETFQHYLEEQLDTGHYWLASRSRVKERMSTSTHWAEGCLVGSCVAEVKTQTGAELVVIAALSGSGTSYGYVVTIVRTDTGEVVSQESDRCDVCTVNEVVQTATIATIKLLTAVPDKLPEREVSTRLPAGPGGSVDRGRQAGRVGLGVTITGLVVGVAGAALYFTRNRDGNMLGLAGAGVGLTLGGLTVLTF
jgi:hypothetical protein